MAISTPWWRSSLNYFWFYLVAGACFAPAGLAYGVATVYHWHEWPVICVSMAFCSVAAIFAWRFLEARICTAETLHSPENVGQDFPLVASTMIAWELYESGENAAIVSRYEIVRLSDLHGDEITSLNTLPEQHTEGTANLIALRAAA